MISIIIPLYNKEHYILDTINSVFCQTNKDWECVIVDDGSTDRGPELVKNIHDSRIKYLKKIDNCLERVAVLLYVVYCSGKPTTNVWPKLSTSARKIPIRLIPSASSANSSKVFPVV